MENHSLTAEALIVGAFTSDAARYRITVQSA